MKPLLIEGSSFSDYRGKLFYNNQFDTSEIRRVYFIENINTSIVRGWQGHKIERRWFLVVSGSFKIQSVKIDNWENPSRSLLLDEFVLTSKSLDVLYLPSGYASSIQALEDKSKLMVMSDYLLDEIQDEFRFDVDYFEK